jgi:hypothetical protein
LRTSANIHQHESTGADRVLSHPNVEASLAKCGRLLIAGAAANRYRLTEKLRRGGSDHLTRRCHARQHRPRHVEQLKHLVAPFKRMKIEQQGARRVADVSDMLSAASEIPDQPRVDRAEREFATQSTCARFRHVVE